MNSKDQDFTQFEYLITELEKPEIRPYAPDLPLDTKNQLRQQLLAPPESAGLSRQAIGNLWKFAGTAVAAFLFIFAVVGLIAILSNPSTQLGAPQSIDSPPTRTPMTTNDSTSAELSTFPTGLSSYAELNDLSQEAVAIGNRIQLLSYEMKPTAEGHTFQSRWRPLAILDEKFHLFVHFLDAEGNLVFQFDGPISEEPIMAIETQTEVTWELPISTQDLNEGIYDIKLGFYNSETGERLPVSAQNPQFVTDNETAVWLGGWDSTALQDRIWLISASPKPGTNLTDVDDVPTTFKFEIGYELYSAEKASLHWDLKPLGNGSLPRVVFYSFPSTDIERGIGTVTAEVTMSSTRPEDIASAVVPEIWLSMRGKQITLPSETLVDLVWPLTPEGPQVAGDQLWLVSAIQKERSSEADPITIEAVIGYHLESKPEAELSLWYVSPEWEAISGDAPISMSEDKPILKGNGEVSFTFSGDPEEISTLINNEQLLLQANIGRIVETNNGQQQQSLIRQTFYDFFVDLSQLDQKAYIGTNSSSTSSDNESGEVWLISATQKERVSANDPVEIEYTLGYLYESEEDVFIKMSYGDAAWQDFDGNGRLPVDGLDNPIYLENKQGELTLNTTLNPREARQIVGTDTPVLIAELGYISESDDMQGNVINFLDHKTFNEFQLDLTGTATHSFSISDSCYAIVTGTDEQGLVLRDAPNGEIITVLAESARTELITTEPAQTINSLSWRKVHVVATNETGWVMDSYLTYEPSPSTARNACPVQEVKNNDILEIISITPESGAKLDSTTTFEIELAYTLTSLPEAEIMVSMFPTTQGTANISEAIHPISQGTGTTTITFDFTPAEAKVASDWNLLIRLIPAGYENLGEAMSNALLTITPHENPDVAMYHYQP